MLAEALLIGALLVGAPAAAPETEPVAPAFDASTGYTVTATAYTKGPESTGKRPGHPQYGITFSGVEAVEGRTIAVDPRKIPLGSLVYIQELGQYRIAQDTGSAIKGDRIDLYMDEVADALQWGVQRVRIQVFRQI